MQLSEWVRAQAPATVGEVAMRLGIRRVALHRIMSGQTFPRAETRQAIERETAGAVTIADLEAAAAAYRACRPVAARDVPAGESWAFTDHRTLAEIV